MLLAILEGLPAGVPVCLDAVDRKLRQRQLGPGRGGRQRIEQDHAEFVAGLRAGETLGSPIGIIVRNRDWENWRGVLGAGVGEVEPAQAEARALYRPRPGHADLAGALKYDRRDLRDVLERASARETAARVAVGAICLEFLAALGVRVLGRVVALGPVQAGDPSPGTSFADLAAAVEASDCRCADAGATAAMHEAIRVATLARDTLGGLIEVVATGVPVGLGSYAASDRRLDGRLAAALMSIQAMKGVEVGMGQATAALRGSAVHDEILVADGQHGAEAPGGVAGAAGAAGPDGMADREGRAGPEDDDSAAAGLRHAPEMVAAGESVPRAGRYRRPTNRAGGIEGGVSNGEQVVVRVAMKPIPTLLKPLRSADMRSGAVIAAGYERSDITSVPAASVVAEGVVAFVLAQAMLEKFGGDSLRECRRNLDGYLRQVAER